MQRFLFSTHYYHCPRPTRSSVVAVTHPITPVQQRLAQPVLQTKMSTPNNNNNNNNNNSSNNTTDADIEELHQQALLHGSTTYQDPTTGFTVFTALAHLQRGTCCGNQCRHCPYGWENVARNNNNTDNNNNSSRQQVRSGDARAIQVRLAALKEAQQEFERMKLQQQGTPLEPSSIAAANKTNTTKTGGRHGGRLTTKNVPYTRGGDAGMTSLLTGERRSKTDVSFEAMGTVDELCSIVGVVYAEWEQEMQLSEPTITRSDPTTNNNAASNNTLATLEEKRIFFQECLLDIMSRLFDIGSHVAKPRRRKRQEDDDSVSSSSSEDEVEFVADGVGGGFDIMHVEELEDWIDLLTEDLPELRSFILPTGSRTCAQLHVARCVCRRAERRVVPLVQDKACDPNSLKYLNRLSDFFFTAARWVNFHGAGAHSRQEIQYRKPTRGAKQRGRVSVSLESSKS